VFIVKQWPVVSFQINSKRGFGCGCVLTVEAVLNRTYQAVSLSFVRTNPVCSEAVSTDGITLKEKLIERLLCR